MGNNPVARSSDVTLLDPEFKKVLDKFFELAKKELPDLKVFESIRSPVRQEELYAKGRDPNKPDFGRTVTKAKAYQSAHQFGLAVDLVFFVNGKWTWDEPKKGDWDKMTKLAKKAGLETLSFEKPHVQIKGFDWRKLSTGPQDHDGWVEWITRRNKR